MQIENPVKQFDKEQIKDILNQFNIESNEDLLNSLSVGDKSTLLKNIVLKNGDVKDGKLQLVEDNKGELHVKFDFVNPEKLIIPEKILDKKLSPEQKEQLEKGEEIKLGAYSIKIDKELNKLVIATGNELRVPDEIGGHKLSNQEKEDLAKGKQIGPVVLYDPKTNKYIVSKVKLCNENKGIQFDSFKEVSKQEALDFKANMSKNNIISATANIVGNIENKDIKEEVKPDNNVVINAAANVVVDVEKTNNTKDLFETPELIPDNIKEILKDFEKSEPTYESCNELVSVLKQNGYECDFTLESEPYGLRKLTELELNTTNKIDNDKINQILNDVDSNKFDLSALDKLTPEEKTELKAQLSDSDKHKVVKVLLDVGEEKDKNKSQLKENNLDKQIGQLKQKSANMKL
jgi:hypothetical protein